MVYLGVRDYFSVGWDTKSEITKFKLLFWDKGWKYIEMLFGDKIKDREISSNFVGKVIVK